MRKLLSIAVLAAALPNMAFAEGETSPAAALEAKITACADASCKEDAIKAALDAGMDINAVVTAAVQAGVAPDSIAAAAMAKGQSAGSVTTALLNSNVNTAVAANAVTSAAINLNLDQGTVQGQIADAVLQNNQQAPAQGPGAPVVNIPVIPEPNPNIDQSPI